MKQPTSAPGTVSKILWHFTGGPLWDDKKQCQKTVPKRPDEAYKALLAILQTRKLLLGKYRELVKAQYSIRKFDPTTKQSARVPKQKIFESVPVCCLADIPIAHLNYHSHRYGKFAIGFHRSAVVKHKFSPVFYALHDAAPLQSIRRAISEVESISNQADFKASEVRTFEETVTCEEGHSVDDKAGNLSDFEWAFDSIVESGKNGRDHLTKALAFIKTFGQAEFSTVYCEREWRSTTEFAFDLSDVAMVVLPRQINGRSFFGDFVESHCQPLLRAIPVVPWEDLVEH